MYKSAPYEIIKMHIMHLNSSRLCKYLFRKSVLDYHSFSLVSALQYQKIDYFIKEYILQAYVFFGMNYLLFSINQICP